MRPDGGALLGQARGGARGRLAVAAQRPRRRHDAARTGARAAGAGRRRAPRPAPDGRRRARVGDERQDDDGRDGRDDPRAGDPALPQRQRRQPRLGASRARCSRRRRPRASGSSRSTRPRSPRSPSHAAACAPARQPLPRPARPLRGARAGRRALAGGPRATRRLPRRRLCRRSARERDHRGRAAPALRPRRPGVTRCPPSSTRPTRRPASAAGRRTSTPRPTSATSATSPARAAGTHAGRSTSRRATWSSAGSPARASASTRRRRRHGRGQPAGHLQRLQRDRRDRALLPARRAAREGAARLRGFRAAFGRFERLRFGDRELVLVLVKNPAGANEALRTLGEDLPGAPCSPC